MLELHGNKNVKMNTNLTGRFPANSTQPNSLEQGWRRHDEAKLPARRLVPIEHDVEVTIELEFDDEEDYLN